MKRSLVISLLVFASAATIQQAVGQAAGQTESAPAGQSAQKPEIKNPAEYNAYINAIQQTNAAQKAQLLRSEERRVGKECW